MVEPFPSQLKALFKPNFWLPLQKLSQTLSIEHNTLHGITPTGVTKRIKDMIEGIYDMESAQLGLKAAQVLAAYEHLTEKQLTKEVKRVEKEMLGCAKNLEFERAAELRDELKRLKLLLFGVEEHD